MTEQPPLNLPPVELRLKMEGKNLKVFDPLRKKYVALTPEEYVRQHFTAWMTESFGYPASLMNNEVSLKLNGTSRRCDTVIFRKDGSPAVVVEYKAPTVAITQNVFDQIARYNMVLRSRFLIVSNGLRHFCCEMDYENDTYRFLPHIPVWTAEI
ncbi:MAG: type I restriction enzyme HsdR N-terminal domain-containing protein [Muribaculaceae bacterium]|nr:type I restriction enzyme HsdR N-terminal domain-containing protein [Muribaculaceae bacterium]